MAKSKSSPSRVGKGKGKKRSPAKKRSSRPSRKREVIESPEIDEDDIEGVLPDEEGGPDDGGDDEPEKEEVTYEDMPLFIQMNVEKAPKKKQEKFMSKFKNK